MLELAANEAETGRGEGGMGEEAAEEEDMGLDQHYCGGDPPIHSPGSDGQSEDCLNEKYIYTTK